MEAVEAIKASTGPSSTAFMNLVRARAFFSISLLGG